MRTLHRFQLLAGMLAAIAACSCGPSETVAVGGPGDQPGVVRRDIDTARLTQTQANAKVAQDSAELDR